MSSIAAVTSPISITERHGNQIQGGGADVAMQSSHPNQQSNYWPSSHSATRTHENNTPGPGYTLQPAHPPPASPFHRPAPRLGDSPTRRGSLSGSANGDPQPNQSQQNGNSAYMSSRAMPLPMPSPQQSHGMLPPLNPSRPLDKSSASKGMSISSLVGGPDPYRPPSRPSSSSRGQPSEQPHATHDRPYYDPRSSSPDRLHSYSHPSAHSNVSPTRADRPPNGQLLPPFSSTLSNGPLPPRPYSQPAGAADAGASSRSRFPESDRSSQTLARSSSDEREQRVFNDRRDRSLSDLGGAGARPHLPPSMSPRASHQVQHTYGPISAQSHPPPPPPPQHYQPIQPPSWSSQGQPPPNAPPPRDLPPHSIPYPVPPQQRPLTPPGQGGRYSNQPGQHIQQPYGGPPGGQYGPSHPLPPPGAHPSAPGPYARDGPVYVGPYGPEHGPGPAYGPIPSSHLPHGHPHQHMAGPPPPGQLIPIQAPPPPPHPPTSAPSQSYDGPQPSHLPPPNSAPPAASQPHPSQDDYRSRHVPIDGQLRKSIEDNQMSHRAIINLGQDARRLDRSSPLPQAVQGASAQPAGSGRDPTIKSEFGRMFSGLGSGMGSTPQPVAYPHGHPSHSPNHGDDDGDFDLRRAATGGKGRQNYNQRKRAYDYSSEDGEGRSSPIGSIGRGMGIKKSRMNYGAGVGGPTSASLLPHHHHHAGAAGSSPGNSLHHHHHYRRPEDDGYALNQTRRTSGTPLPAGMKYGPAGPGSFNGSVNGVVQHHHHHHHHHPPHHHHHMTPGRGNVGSSPTPMAIQPMRVPSTTIKTKPLLQEVSHRPRLHLGSQLYEPSIKPPATSVAADAKFLFSTLPKSLPKFEDRENCTYMIRVARDSLSHDARMHVCQQRRVWGTDVYTDDSDVLAAAIHSGWIRGAWEAGIDEELILGLPPREETPEASVKAVQDFRRRKLTEPPATEDGPVIPPLNMDLHITILILPPLQGYAPTTWHGMRSRKWGDNHDGMSFKIHSIEWVDEPRSVRFEETGIEARNKRLRRQSRLRDELDHTGRDSKTLSESMDRQMRLEKRQRDTRGMVTFSTKAEQDAFMQGRS